MKKFLLVAVALISGISAYAQFGIMAGLTSSATDIKSAVVDVQSKNINQYHVGITYKLPIGNVFAIQPSLIYTMKGQKLEEVITGYKMNLQYKTGYLELPVQLQAGVNVLNILRIYGIAEPFVGYALSNTVMDGGNKLELKDAWENVKNRLEYGVGLGLGVEVIKHIQVSARYFWNLGDVYQGLNVGDALSVVSSSKCNGIIASVAYIF